MTEYRRRYLTGHGAGVRHKNDRTAFAADGFRLPNLDELASFGGDSGDLTCHPGDARDA